MRVVSFSDARNNLKDVLDTVASDCSITIIHRREHEDAVVMEGLPGMDRRQENPSTAIT